MITKFENKIIRSMKNYVDQIVTAISKFEFVGSKRDGYFISCMILINLQKSYYSIATLLYKGFAIEANIISRFIYEQLCYCLAIYDKNEDEINKIDIKKTIKYMKQIDPYFNRLYGELSNYVHFDIKKMLQMIKLEQNIDKSKTARAYIKEYERNYENDIVEIYSVLVLLQYFVIEIVMENKNEKEENHIIKIGKRLEKTLKQNLSYFHKYESIS